MLLKKTQQQPTSFYRTVAPAPCSPPYPPPPLHFSEIKFDFSPPGQRGRAGGRDGGGGENCHAPPPPLASPFNLRREGGEGAPTAKQTEEEEERGKVGWEREGGPEEQKQREIYGYEFFPPHSFPPRIFHMEDFSFPPSEFFLKRGKLGVFRIGISNSEKLLFFQREGKRCFAPKSPPPFLSILHST